MKGVGYSRKAVKLAKEFTERAREFVEDRDAGIGMITKLVVSLVIMGMIGALGFIYFGYGKDAGSQMKTKMDSFISAIGSP